MQPLLITSQAGTAEFQRHFSLKNSALTTQKVKIKLPVSSVEIWPTKRSLSHINSNTKIKRLIVEFIASKQSSWDRRVPASFQSRKFRTDDSSYQVCVLR